MPFSSWLILRLDVERPGAFISYRRSFYLELEILVNKTYPYCSMIMEGKPAKTKARYDDSTAFGSRNLYLSYSQSSQIRFAMKMLKRSSK